MSEFSSHSLSDEKLLEYIKEGDRYYFGKDNYSVNKEKAIQYFETAANNGQIYAQLMSGYMYDFGDGVNCDPTKAIKYYTEAALQGELNAALNLANVYLLGRGVPKDIERAIFWLKKAAENGNAIAQSSLGCQYVLGDGVEKSISKADYWITKAENSGYINCETMTKLGLMYEETGDSEKAFNCFEKALDADPDDLNIQYLYGKYKFYGKGTNRDVKQAKIHIKWVVDQNPQSRRACELLNQILLYEQINSALDIIRSTISNQCYVWDVHILVTSSYSGFYTFVRYSELEQNSFMNTNSYERFLDFFTIYNDDSRKTDEEKTYKAFINYESTESANFEKLEQTMNLISKDFNIEPFRKMNNNYTLSWRT